MADDGAHLALTTPAVPAALDVVQDALQDLWAIHPTVGAGDRTRFERALVEIVGNVVEHAYAEDLPHDGDGRELDLRVTVSTEALVAELGDDGRPVEIDLGRVTVADLDSESGRGLALALASVDHLEHRREGGRNTWLLRCDLAPA